jgi:hypothetical protein
MQTLVTGQVAATRGRTSRARQLRLSRLNIGWSRTAEGDVLAISIPRTEAHVIRHFQEQMPYGLFVPDEPTSL